MDITKQELKKQRVIKYFIEAASLLAMEEGLSNLTIRKVSDRAGYNSATLYNYFDNMDQLLAFSAINCVSAYWKALSNTAANTSHPVARYMLAWSLYIEGAYDNPELYNYVFIPKDSKNIFAYLKQYYTIFPEQYDVLTPDLQKIVIEEKHLTRDLLYLLPCIDAGIFSPESSKEILEMAYLLRDGLVFQIMHEDRQTKRPVSYFVETFNKYFKQHLEAYNISGSPLFDD